MIEAAYSDRVRARFWSKVRVAPADACWEWFAGRVGPGSYGQFEVGLGDGIRKNERAHRVAWRLCGGDIPDGLYLCHHCDNPGCVNPSHLFLGTAMDNARDMVAKGRQSLAGLWRPEKKLTEAVVAEIQRENREHGVSTRALAKRLGISKSSAAKALKMGHEP